MLFVARLPRLALALVLLLMVLAPMPADGTPTRNLTPTPAAHVVTRVATFNALGYSHTAPGGNKPGWLGGVARTRLAVKIFDYRRLDVIALQEFQPPQQTEFRRIAGDRYGLWCPANRHGRDNCVAWRRTEWRLISSGYFTVPYFHGVPRRMPHVTLASRLVPGVRLDVTSVHNPCSCYGPARAWRVEGWAREASVAAAAGDRAVVLMGDRNALAPSYLPRRPDGYRAAGRRGIDFIAGSARTCFVTYHSIRTHRIRRATDHPLVFADTTVRSAA